MEEQHRRRRALVEVVHAQPVLLEVVRLEVVAGQALEALVRGAVCVHRTTLRRCMGFVVAGNGLAAMVRASSSHATGASEDETVVAGDWPVRPEGRHVVVEQAETVPPRRRLPVIWPWLLALLVLVLAGLGAAYFFTRDDDEPTATTTAPTASTATATTDTAQVTGPGRRRYDVVRGDGHASGAGLEANSSAVPSDKPPGQVVAQNPVGRRGGVRRLDGEAERRQAAKPAPTTTAPDDDRSDHDRAPEPATVPDVVGQELADAAPRVQRRGAEGRRRVTFPRTSRQGRVVAQAQTAGRRAPGAATPCSSTSRPEPSPAPDVQVPDVTGGEKADGRDQSESPPASRCSARRAHGRRSRGVRALAVAPGGANDPARLARAPVRRRLDGYFGAGSSL